MMNGLLDAGGAGDDMMVMTRCWALPTPPKKTVNTHTNRAGHVTVDIFE